MLLWMNTRVCSLVSGSRPLLAAYPESKDEVRGIVRMAGEFKMPLVPVSSGPRIFMEIPSPPERRHPDFAR
jgi:hypothetical protein